MNKYFLAIPVIVCSIALSCNSASEEQHSVSPTIGNAAWVIGKWQQVTDQGVITETWEKLNDSTYSGAGYFVKGGDTLFSESIALEQKGTELYYTPTVKGQNDDKPIPFRLKSMSDKVMVFQNPMHDFPQKITYTHVSNDSLLAEIAGMIDGKMHSEFFPMSRVK